MAQTAQERQPTAEVFQELLHKIDEAKEAASHAVAEQGGSREMSLVVTKLDEAQFWANRASGDGEE